MFDLAEWYRQSYPLKEGQFETKPNRCVYVLYNSVTRLYKIGHSSSLRIRQRALKNQSGCDIYRILAIYTETSQDLFPSEEIDFSTCDESVEFIEGKLHAFFASKRKSGEWFNLHIKDIIKIRELFYEVIEGWDIEDYISEHAAHLKNPTAYEVFPA